MKLQLNRNIVKYKLDDGRLKRMTKEGEKQKYLYVIPKLMRKSIVVKH